MTPFLHPSSMGESTRVKVKIPKSWRVEGDTPTDRTGAAKGTDAFLFFAGLCLCSRVELHCQSNPRVSHVSEKKTPARFAPIN